MSASDANPASTVDKMPVTVLIKSVGAQSGGRGSYQRGQTHSSVIVETSNSFQSQTSIDQPPNALPAGSTQLLSA